MDPELRNRTEKYIRSAGLSIEHEDHKCLLEIIKFQDQRIKDLEDHMEFALNKIEKLNKNAGLSTE